MDPWYETAAKWLRANRDPHGRFPIDVPVPAALPPSDVMVFKRIDVGELARQLAFEVERLREQSRGMQRLIRMARELRLGLGKLIQDLKEHPAGTVTEVVDSDYLHALQRRLAAFDEMHDIVECFECVVPYASENPSIDELQTVILAYARLHHKNPRAIYMPPHTIEKLVLAAAAPVTRCGVLHILGYPVFNMPSDCFPQGGAKEKGTSHDY